MKVNDTSGTGVSGLGKAQELTSTGSSSKTRGHRGAHDDQVSLSSLSSALSAGETDSPQQTARLSQLSAAVEAGRYQVNALAISSDIIRSSIRA